MKKILSYSIVLSLLIIIPSAQTIAQKDTEEQIKTILTEMWAAIENKDIEKYAQYLHQDYTSFGEYDHFLNEGRDLELRNTKNWLSNLKHIHTDMHNAKVTVKGEVAWITYYWTDYGEENEKAFASKGKSTRIFVKQNNKWLCIHAHFTALQD